MENVRGSVIHVLNSLFTGASNPISAFHVNHSTTTLGEVKKSVPQFTDYFTKPYNTPVCIARLYFSLGT